MNWQAVRLAGLSLRCESARRPELRAFGARLAAGGVRSAQLAYDRQLVPEGAEFSPKTFTVKDGYLFDPNERKTVTLYGFNQFIMVIRP